MTRLMYGGGITDVYLTADGDGDLHQTPAAAVLFYNAETGGTQYTDLLDINSQPVTYVATSTGADGRAVGQIPPFYGPDGVFEMWASAAGSPRFLMMSSTLGSYVGPTKLQVDAHLSAGNNNPHGVRLRDLGGVDGTDVAAAVPGEVVTMGSGGLWGASPPASQTGWFNVRNYGAVGDGVADDSAAVQAALAAIPTQGGVLYFPPGTYVIGSTLSLLDRRGVIMAGAGTRGATASTPTAAVLKWTGSGSGRFIDARHTTGFQMRDLFVHATNTSFTGTLIDLGWNGTQTTAYAKVSNISLVAATGVSCTGILLNWCMVSRIESCHFTNLLPAIVGRSTASDQANAISIVDCVFDSVGIKNPGQSWTIDACTFEGPSTDVAQGIYHDSGVTCEGLTVRGCWTGDTTSGVQWQVAGIGMSFAGNWIGCTGGTGIYIDEASTGFHIAGNEFRNGTYGLRMAANCAQYAVIGNHFQGQTNGIDQITATSHTNFMLFGNKFASVTAPYVAAQQPIRIDESLAGPGILIHNADTTTDGRATIRLQADRTSVKAYDIGIDPNGTGTINKGLSFFDRTAALNRGLITTAGSWVLASATADLATTATDGFTYLPAMVGAATGVPPTVVGAIPVHIDRTAPGKIRAYISSSWRDFTPTLAATATLDFPSIATGRSADLTMTVTGAAVGDPCAVSSPASFTGVLLYAYVSAADTVTVRMFNATSGALDAAASSFTVKVLK